MNTLTNLLDKINVAVIIVHQYFAGQSGCK